MPTDRDDEAGGPSGAQEPAPPKDPRSYDARGSAGEGKDGASEGKGDDKDEEKNGKAEHKGLLQRPVTLIVLIVVVLAVIVLAVLFWLHARNYQSTDDAFVDTHIVRVAPRISGRVSKVLVDDNEIVRAGQKLIEIDAQDQLASLDQSRATEAQADAQIAQAQAQFSQSQAQVKTAQATYAQNLAQVSGAQAQATNAARDYARYLALKAVNASAVSQQQLDQSESQARNTAAQRDAAARQAAGARSQIEAALAQGKTALAQIAAGQAQKKSAEANIRTAQLNLNYTGVEAAVTGTVAQRTVQVGAYLNAGAQIMAIVPLRTWVTANFKETQLDLMRAGQSATIKVDACPHALITGHVDSIQRGSGQAFGVLPPENATGNFVKVVQRVPVKIVLDSFPRDCPLGPGLSVEPKVRVR